MDDRETLMEAVHTLHARLETLRTMEGPELLLPDRIGQYRSTLEDAYASFSKIETIIDALGQELDYQDSRFDEGVKKYGE